MIVGDVMDGPEVGLKAAPCLAPATSHWFSGLGATDADRTDLILSNPDDAQAQVDLRFYGRSGRVAVPGSPGGGDQGARVAHGVAEQPGRGRGRAQRGGAGESGSGHRSGQADRRPSAQARWSRLADSIGIAEHGGRHPGHTGG